MWSRCNQNKALSTYFFHRSVSGSQGRQDGSTSISLGTGEHRPVTKWPRFFRGESNRTQHFWRGTFSWVDNTDILWMVDAERALSATAICWASYTVLGTCIKIFTFTSPILTKPSWAFLSASCKITCMHCMSKAWSSPQLRTDTALACAVRVCLQPHFKTNSQESDVQVKGQQRTGKQPTLLC